ncbi:MAG: hypothetical protein ACTSQ8_22200, partial [Candidatus Helarchaeota archaeon]
KQKRDLPMNLFVSAFIKATVPSSIIRVIAHIFINDMVYLLINCAFILARFRITFRGYAKPGARGLGER